MKQFEKRFFRAKRLEKNQRIVITDIIRPDDDYYESGYYNNLGEKYDEAIDDDEEDFETIGK